MKSIALSSAAALLLTTLGACGPKLTPRERYVQALNHRMDGDAKAYYDGMLALAHEEPDTRAGHRARATIQGGGALTTVAVIGVLAAIAVPQFMKFKARSVQSEAKTNLQALRVAFLSYREEHGRICKSFSTCGYVPPTGSRYIYLLTPDEAAGADATEDPSMLRLRAYTALAELGLEPKVGKEELLMVAAGNIDGDDDLDIWSIDETGELTNVANDVN